MNAKAAAQHTISTVPLHKPSQNPQAGSGFPWGKIFLLLLVAALGYGVYQRLQGQPAQMPGFGMGGGAVPVDVVTIEQKSERLWTSFSGRLTAVEQAEIRPQVGGRITKVNFTEGAWVQKGQPLLVIDPRPYQAEVDRAQAAVTAAETRLRLANLEMARARTLISKQAIAQRLYDERENNAKVAESDLLAARGALLQATVDLGHAYVTSPITGRAGRPELTVGNVVETGGGQAPILTTVVDSRKLYAEFNVDEDTYINLLSDSKPGKDRIPVKMTLGEKGAKVYEGVLTAFDNSFNTTTGTIRARAVFDNKDGELVSGLFANVQIGTAKERAVLAVPEAAINTDQTKKFVLAVDDQNKAVYREVTLGQAVEGGRVVLTGLNEGDRVVVSGLQRIQPGAAVQPLTPFDKTGLVEPAAEGKAPEAGAPAKAEEAAPAIKQEVPVKDAKPAEKPAAPAPAKKEAPKAELKPAATKAAPKAKAE